MYGKIVVHKTTEQKSHISRNPTDPTFLGTFSKFLRHLRIFFFSIFRLILNMLNDFHAFPIQKIISKKNFLPRFNIACGFPQCMHQFSFLF